MKSETLWKMAYFSAFFGLFFLVVWIDLPSEMKMSVEMAIRCYQGILLSIGTLVLISLLALAAAQISSSSAERREASNRAVTAELKISEFRQEWINELRAETSEVISVASKFTDLELIARKKYHDSMFDAETSSDCDFISAMYEKEFSELKAEAIRKLKTLEAKIRMRLNQNQTNARLVLDSLFELVNEVEKHLNNPDEISIAVEQSREKFAKFAIKYLKDEWDDLKLRLKEARMLEV